MLEPGKLHAELVHAYDVAQIRDVRFVFVCSHSSARLIDCRLSLSGTGSALSQLSRMTTAQTQVMTLWELAGADPNCVFSPFVWRVRLALYYKEQSYKSVPWRCTEKDLIKPSEKATFAQLPPAVPFLRACGHVRARQYDLLHPW